MFEHLRKHNKILVTGPHRSGTTIAATMIAKDTDRGVVKEELCHFSRRILTVWLTEVEAPIVVQAPFAADLCHLFPSVCVVFMDRDQNDINASRERAKVTVQKPSIIALPITFERETTSKEVQWHRIDCHASHFYHSSAEKIDQIKRENWQAQKEKIAYPVDLEYESLRPHPLWIEDRSGLGMRDTYAVG